MGRRPCRQERRLRLLRWHLLQLADRASSLCRRAIVALVYNVLKAFMEMNSTMFDELTATYKSDRQR